MKNSKLYEAMGNIDDDIIKETEAYQAEKRDHPNLRAALYCVGIAAIICSFFVFSLFLQKISGPKTDPAATDTGTVTELSEDPDTQTEFTDGTTDAEAPDTAADTGSPDTAETPWDKALIKLYSNVYDGLLGVVNGQLVKRDYKGIYRNPDRTSKTLPGIEALDLKETMKDEEVYAVIGYTAGGVSLSDEDYVSFWDYETSDGYTFYLTARFIREDNANSFRYEFDALPLALLKAEIIKAELQKDGISEGLREEYEDALSKLESIYNDHTDEYCGSVNGFVERLCGYGIDCNNDAEYAMTLLNVTFSAITDYMGNKGRAYSAVDYDDDLRRLLYDGFILEDFCDLSEKYGKVSDILKKTLDMLDKMKIKNNEIRRVHEVSPYTEYDFLINYKNNGEYSEYVRVSTRYNAVFYYKEAEGKETVYSLIYKEDGAKETSPDLIRGNAVSAGEFEKATGINTDFSYDQDLIDSILDSIYSHAGTSDMTYRLKEAINFGKEGEAVKKDPVESDCAVYCLPNITKVPVTLESPYVAYGYISYPEYPGVYGGSAACITRVSFTSDKIRICGIGVNSSFEEFEAAFAPLGFTITKDGDTYKAENKDTGMMISVYSNSETNERVMLMNLSPIQRHIIFY